MLLLSESCFMGALGADDARRYLDSAAGPLLPWWPWSPPSSAVLPGGGAAARSGRVGIVFPFFGLRCSPDRSPGASGCQRPTDSFIHWRRKLCVFLQFLLHLAVPRRS